ncbi:MAG: septation protein IspZ [Burkholderiales bacterium]|nr:septation protein IspZ [Burkholderiales bacterium]
MKNNFLIEMMPLIAFFVAYYITKNIYTATLVCIIASWLQVAINKITTKKVSKNTWISTLLITVLGTLTIAFHNKTFIMVKPTALYWAFAIGMFIAGKMGKNPLKALLGEQISINDGSWKQLNLLWIIFFIGMGILNLVIAFHFSEYVWVKFKVFGSLALTLIFTLFSGLFIYKKQKELS